MQKEGRIYRQGKEIVVQLVGANNLAGLPGVECINPTAEESDQIWQKIFRRKPIYLPREYSNAKSNHLSGTDVIVLGINGYSSLTPAQCLAWGVKEGAYEAACKKILAGTITYLQEKFSGIDVRVVHGASNIGVDRSAIEVATRMNRPQLGHNCPKFMFYVEDDYVPVYVAATQADYAQAFVRSLDILIAANGRIQAFEHDIEAAFKLQKHIIPVNVLKSISATGGPPAFNERKGIEDAVAAMEALVHMMSMRFGYSRADVFTELCDHVNEVAGLIARNSLSPERAFPSA